MTDKVSDEVLREIAEAPNAFIGAATVRPIARELFEARAEAVVLGAELARLQRLGYDALVARDAATETARQSERAAVVAYLNGFDEAELATAIERGEHEGSE